MEHLSAVVWGLLVLLMATYGLLLVICSPFGGPKLANRYAWQFWRAIWRLTVWEIKLPLKLLFQIASKKRKRMRKRKKRKKKRKQF